MGTLGDAGGATRGDTRGSPGGYPGVYPGGHLAGTGTLGENMSGGEKTCLVVKKHVMW